MLILTHWLVQMNVVSLLPNGSVRSGAGTTVFFKTNPPPPFGVGSKVRRITSVVAAQSTTSSAESLNAMTP